MKIYFAGSITAGREYSESYKVIIGYLQKYGEVLTEHVGTVGVGGEKKEMQFIHDRDIAWVKESDVLVGEISVPSLGVGYEIGRAVESKKKVLCLYHQKADKRLSAMIGGCSQIVVYRYNDLTETENLIKTFFDELE